MMALLVSTVARLASSQQHISSTPLLEEGLNSSAATASSRVERPMYVLFCSVDARCVRYRSTASISWSLPEANTASTLLRSEGLDSTALPGSMPAHTACRPWLMLPGITSIISAWGPQWNSAAEGGPPVSRGGDSGGGGWETATGTGGGGVG